jgi:hypothetical protein
MASRAYVMRDMDLHEKRQPLKCHHVNVAFVPMLIPTERVGPVYTLWNEKP